MKKFLLMAVASAVLCTGTAFAQVIVRVAPPPPIVEHHDAERHGYVWVDGYHRWDGHRYNWVHGRWVHPPRPGVAWVPGHWDPRPGGYIWVEGHWR